MIDRMKRLSQKNKCLYYMIYILFVIHGFIFSTLCLLMRCFPIKKNKIVCCDLKGKQYGDNPRYITEELLAQNADVEIVWLLNENFSGDLPEGIRKAGCGMVSMAFELSTAKIWIDSHTKTYGILKRKGQYYIQTWHGSYGFKKLYKDIPRKASLFDKKNIEHDFKMQDLFVSNSRFYSEIYRRAFGYGGEILECGSPRNDIFFTGEEKYREKVCGYFHTGEKKMALYAPTWRDDFSVDACRLDWERVRKNLERRFGGQWVVLVRLHPQNRADAEAFVKNTEGILDANEYDMMQELLVACDVLISDYSSCILDFATSGKACFIYASDIEKYKTERDFYFDLYELPFPVAKTNDEMERAILNFDQEHYRLELQKLFDDVGLCENGTACRQVADRIRQIMDEE